MATSDPEKSAYGFSITRTKLEEIDASELKTDEDIRKFGRSYSPGQILRDLISGARSIVKRSIDK